MTRPRRGPLVATFAALALFASATIGAAPVSARAPEPAAPRPTSISTAADPGTPAPVSAPASPVAGPGPSSTPVDSTMLIEDNPKLDSQLLVAAGVPGSAPESTGDVPRYDGDRVSVVVSGPAAADAVAGAGGEVIAESGGVIAAYVPSSQLTGLADSDLVTAVRAPAQAEPSGVITDGIAPSGAAAWHAAGQGGDGVVVAVVDIGFKGLAQETSVGNLPEGLTVASNRCGSSVDSSPHGTGVAEIVHQMAPGAQLVLYCIRNSAEFLAAAQDIAAAGIKIATSSLGFPGDARGDGVLEDPMSAAAAVRHAHEDAGIFWIQSAGNDGDAHFRGTLDASGSQRVDTVSAMSFANAAALEWDQWAGPVSNVKVCVTQFRYLDDPDSSDPALLIESPTGSESCSASNSGPSGDVPRVTRSMPAVSGAGLFYAVRISSPPALSGSRFDITYTYGTWNGVSSPKLSSNDPLVTGGSITSPASSPYAFAVGAVDATSKHREDFSSVGPTIDGRTKPDIAGYDNTLSNIYTPRFLGTSAAAPSVAGIAALLLAAIPTLDAAGLKGELLARANAGAPSAADNRTGAGLLSLGSPTAQPAPALITSRFTAVDPVRIRDTRYGPGAIGQVGPGQEITVDAGPFGVPAGATAVVINLTGDGATASTVLAAYPRLFAGTSNLNLAPGDATAAASVTVPVVNGTFRVRNHNGYIQVIVDLLGFYAPGSGAGYSSVPPTRVLDTRTSLTPSGTAAPVPPTGVLAVQITGRAGVPVGATAVAINLTVADVPVYPGGYISVYPTAFTTFSTLNYLGFDRANLAIVKLDPTGKLRVQNAPTGTGGPVNLIVDVLGYYSNGGASFVPRTPNRIIDTRVSIGMPTGAFAADGSRASFDRDQVPAIPRSPGTPAAALLLNVTAVASGSGFLSVYRGQGGPPEASTVNFTAGRIVPNATYAEVDGQGYFSIYGRGFNTDVVVDVFGFFV